jgi:uncharacterized protein
MLHSFITALCEVKLSNCRTCGETDRQPSMTKHNPHIWILASPHTGDNTQLMALVENLGWPYDVKMLSYQNGHALARLLLGATLTGLTSDAQSQITSPYPDLIIGAGRPTEAVALWIKKHANPSVKLVYLGTPWANLNNFDLIITTPQYGLPQRSNILHNQLPMHKVTKTKLTEATKIWEAKFKHLPKPWTAILVGGESGPYTFGREAAQRLSVAANNLKGSVLITTSARTPLTVVEHLHSALTVPNHFHKWNSAATDNPFLGFLALADQFIVTADSISMLSEACATGKPVILFDTEDGVFRMNDSGKPISFWGRNISATAFRFAMRLGPSNWSRDLRIVHKQLIHAGRAQWLGDDLRSQTTNMQNDLEHATSRVKALFDL